MDKIRLALVGCGGMGTRHLYGLGTLAKTPFNNVELVAVCDLRRDNAELAAAEAQRLVGQRPAVFTELETMHREVADLMAVDVVVDPSAHHAVVCQALDLGLHVMVEKPMAITVKGCRQMIEAAQRNKRVLSVAENFRRDPSARLVHHLLEQGAIGRPYMAIFHSLAPQREVFITPWRHLKDRGGLLLDLGVHFTDLIRYQLGDIETAYGAIELATPVRHKPEAVNSPYAFYQTRFAEMDPQVAATAEDTSMALLRMESGIAVNWVVGLGGYGACSGELILGSEGVLQGFGTRGARARLQRADGTALDHAALVASAAEFVLEPLAEHFFPARVADSDIDWKLLALEYFELAEAILNGREIEVDGMEGLKDVAAVYAIFESSRLGRAVQLSEIESGAVYAYQAEIDAALGIS